MATEDMSTRVNFSTVDGMGFDEVNQPSNTEMISGTNLYGVNLWVSATGEINNVSGLTGSFGEVNVTEGLLQSTSIDNATSIYGNKIQAGSVKTGNYASGLIHFKTNFANIHWVMTLSPNQLTNPYLYQVSDFSGLVPCISGIKNDSGCWIYGGSQTVYDWIAVGP